MLVYQRVTWIKAIWGWFPYKNHDSSEGEQWGRDEIYPGKIPGFETSQTLLHPQARLHRRGTAARRRPAEIPAPTVSVAKWTTTHLIPTWYMLYIHVCMYIYILLTSPYCLRNFNLGLRTNYIQLDYKYPNLHSYTIISLYAGFYF